MNLWPQSLKTYKKNSMFIKVLLFFTLLAVICTLVVGYGTYIVSSRLLVEEVGNANFRLLQQAKEAVDKEITMLNKISLQVAADRRINKALFVEVRNSATDIQLSQEIIVYLNSLKLTYSDWATLWLYFDKSQTVLSHEGRFSADFFFKEFSYRRSGVDWGKILNSYAAFHSVGRETIGSGSGAVPVITLIRSMPLFEYLPLGMIVFDVKERLFGNIINMVSGKTPVVTYVLDRQGNVLFCNEKERNPNDAPFLQEALRKNLSLFSGAGSMQRGIKGRKYTISYISSSVTDWQYVSIIPTRYITQKVSYVGYLTLIVVIACLLIGLILSYCLTRKIYHPIHDILRSIQALPEPAAGAEPAGDELKFINRIICYLQSEKNNLRDVFDKSLPMLREKFLTDILEGKVTETELAEIGWRLDLDFRYELFQVIVVEIDDCGDVGHCFREAPNLYLAQSVTAVTTAEFLSDQARIHIARKGNDQLFLIVNLSKTCNEAGLVYDLLRKTAHSFHQERGLTITSGVGDVYHGVTGCAASCNEALTALKHKIVKGQNTIIHYDEVRNIPQQSFDYPMEIEKRIVNLLKAGDLPSVLNLFESILRRNLDQREHSPEMIENLFNALAVTVIRTIYDLHATVEEVFRADYHIYQELNGKKTIEDKKDCLTGLFAETVRFIQTKKQAHNQVIHERVRNYIAVHYAAEISLDSVAEAVGLSPSYLSWVFKEVSGVNFIDYINKFRIEKSKQLLVDKALSVSEVARRVGYTNSNTFIKVFKKYEGITPGQFRETE